VIGALPFAWVVEPEVPRHARPPLGAYVRKIARGFVGRAALRRFVTADLLAVTGVVVIWQFGAVALGRFGIDRSWAGRWTAITAAAQLTAALAILLLGHRLLPRRGLTFGALAMGAGAAVAAFARTPAAFALVGALGGTFYTIRIVLHSPQVMRLCAGRDVTGPIGLAMALSSLVTGLGPFAAGWAIPAFGHRAVFLGVACACLTAAILLARWVPDRGELPVD